MTKELEPIDHVTNYPPKYLEQYQDSALLDALVGSMILPLNDFEDQFTLFKTLLTIDSATGRNLDLIGDLLNGTTRPVDDDIYRKYLFGLVAAYNSTGTGKEIIDISNKIIEAEFITITEDFDAAFSIYVTNSVNADFNLLREAILIAKAAGVQLSKIVVTNEPIYFGFDTDTSPDSGTFDILGNPFAGAGAYSIIV